MKKYLLIPIFLFVTVFVLAALAAMFAELFMWVTGVLHVQHDLGIDTQASKNYDSVSGYLPIIVTTMGFSGIIVTAWRHLNCHKDGCWRIAKYPVAGGKYKVCKIHSPDKNVQEGLTDQHLLTAHESHEAGLHRKIS